jgi:predicted TIM-barrel fold metal-dependent hydrolase
VVVPMPDAGNGVSAGTPVIDSHTHYWEPPTRERPHASDGIDLGPAVSDEALVAEAMDAGVDVVIQVTPSCMGFDNRYSLEGAERNPDHVRVFGRLDPLAPPDTVDAWLEHPLAVGVRLTLQHEVQPWATDAAWAPFWIRCAERGMPVAIYAPDQLAALGTLADTYPELILLVDHCALGYEVVDPFHLWGSVLDLADKPNIYMKVSHFPESFAAEGYPYPTGQRRLREVVDRFGADRTIWGSNFPPVRSACSYAEAVSFVRDSDVLNDVERALVLGGTLARLLRWENIGPSPELTEG